MKSFRIDRRMLLFVGLFLSGCAAWTPPITKDDRPAATDTYLYGKFKIDAPKTLLAMDGYQTMGFVFSCDNNKQYTIRFSIEHPIQVIKLNPATCSMKETIFTNSDGQIMARKPVPKGMFENIVLEPGFSYYLGDYFAASQTTSGYYSVRTTWGIKEVKNQYLATTEEMKSIYPNMASFPTIDRMANQ